MKNTLFKKVLAVALACTMTFSMATVTHAADAKEISAVDVVSGATYSSKAIRDAILDALGLGCFPLCYR